jgi:hypothetical protein
MPALSGLAGWRAICSRIFHQLIGTQEDRCYRPLTIADSRASSRVLSVL